MSYFYDYYGSTYQDIMNAVTNYYGAGSDQWYTMFNWTAHTPSEINGILNQVPGVTSYVNESGQLVARSLETSASAMSTAEAGAAAAANAINSNATTAAAVTEQLAVPANAAAGAQAGTVAITSGATKVATSTKASTILGHVGTWVIGAGVGLKAGVWLDAGLYESGLADLWDPENAWAYNPQTWKDYKIGNWLYDNSGYDDFTALFNADDQQLYIDQNLFALMAQYLASQGFFNPANGDVIRGDLPDSDFYYPENLPASVILASNAITWQKDGYTFYCAITGSGDINVAITGNGRILISSDAQFNYDVTLDGNPYLSDTGIYVESPGGTGYYMAEYAAGVDLTTVTSPYNPGLTDYNVYDVTFMMTFGVHDQAPIEGVHQYDTVPTGITPQMTPDQVLDLLRQQYPDLFNDKLKQGQLNDDGTITDHYYLPIGLPSGGPEGQPETDPEHPGAVDPSNPTTVQTIVKIIQPTPDPTPDPQDPDTGEGTTPTVTPPTGTASALYKIYNPTVGEIASFGAWLWSPNFVDQLLKMFNDPMQAIISLHKIYGTPHVGGRSNIKVGYLDSGVASNYVDEQYIDIDCGTITVNEKSASVLDYAPFVDMRLFLPFIGIVPLDTADVMRGQLGVKYRIDVLTGTLIATVSVTRDAGAGGVIYQYTGSCAELYPLSSGSYMGIVTGMLGIAAGVAGTIATGGAAAPALLGGAAGLTAMHTRVEHSNGFSGNAGALGCKKPYLIISRSQGALSNAIGENSGWPANILKKLSQCSGYTRVKAVHLNGIDGATDTELNEIETLLKNGVII